MAKKRKRKLKSAPINTNWKPSIGFTGILRGPEKQGKQAYDDMHFVSYQEMPEDYFEYGIYPMWVD